MTLIALVLGIALGAASLYFIIQNTAPVALSFLTFNFTASLAIVVIASILVGILFALILVLPGAIGSAWSMRRLEKQARQLRSEADQHKQAAEVAKARLDQNEAQGPQVVVNDLR